LALWRIMSLLMLSRCARGVGDQIRRTADRANV